MRPISIKYVLGNRYLAENAFLAETFLERALGLLGRESLANGEGLWLKPCASIHTFGMRFSLDLIFLDAQFRVVKVVENLKPWRLAFASAASAVELPTGVLKQIAVKAGDKLQILEG